MKPAEFLAILLITAACLISQLVSLVLRIDVFSAQGSFAGISARLLAYSVLCGTTVGLSTSAMFPLKIRDRSQVGTVVLSVLSTCIGFVLYGLVVGHAYPAESFQVQLWRYAGSAVVAVVAVGLPGVFRGYRLGHSAKLAGVAALVWISIQAIDFAVVMVIMRDFNPR